MSRIVGTVTRTTPNTIIPAQQTAQGNAGAFSAQANGQRLRGIFRNVREAQLAVQAALGGALARWSRQDLPGRIEHYVGRTGRDDPREIYGSDLQLWAEADAGVIFVPAGPPSVRLFGDRSGRGNNLTATIGAEPEIAGIASRPTLEFKVTTDVMSSPVTLVPTAPFAVTLLAAHSGAAVDRVAAQIAGTPLIIFADAGDSWTVSSTGPAIAAPATPPDVLAVVQLTYKPGPPTELELFVNGVSAGVSAGSFASGSFLLSDLVASSPFIGFITSVVVAADADTAKRVQTYLYFRNKYNTP